MSLQAPYHHPHDVSLPNGIGKSKKVIAFCEDADVEAAKAAGAIEAGTDELVKKITDGWMDFDVAIASPRVMGKVGKLGRLLGLLLTISFHMLALRKDITQFHGVEVLHGIRLGSLNFVKKDNYAPYVDH